MKKLMFVAAAVAAGVAVADVTSANVVGYTHDGLTSGQWKPVCSQFIKVGSEDGKDMTLGELLPNLDGVSTHWAKADVIKVLNTSGAVDFQAKYYRWADLTTSQKSTLFDNDESKFTTGWYKCASTTGNPITAECLNDYKLPYGSAVLARTTKTAANIQSAGQVFEGDDGFIYLGLTSGQWRYLGNCTPVDLKLGDFVPNLDGVSTHWAKADVIKFLNASGAVDFQAKYYRWADLTSSQKSTLFNNDEANFTTGWYKCANTTGNPITAECLNNWPVKAGSGFLARTTKTAANIKLPSAL